MNTTFTEFEQYLLTLGRAPNTVSSYLSGLQIFAQWVEQTTGAPFAPQNITTETLQDYRNHLRSSWRQTTANARMTALYAYLEWAVSSGQIDHNPAQDLRPLPQDHQPPRWLDHDEQDALLQAIEHDLTPPPTYSSRHFFANQRNAYMILLLLNTGLRVSECVALRLSDVQLSEHKGRLTVHGGKGRKRRSIPLNRTARQALQDWLAVRPDIPGNDCLFLTVEKHSSCPIHYNTAQSAVIRYCEKAGVRDVPPQILRHTFARNLAEAGVHLEKVAALLGLKNLNAVRVYYSFDEQDLADAVERLVDVPKQKRPPDGHQADVIARVQARLATGKDFPPELVRKLLDVTLQMID